MMKLRDPFLSLIRINNEMNQKSHILDEYCSYLQVPGHSDLHPGKKLYDTHIKIKFKIVTLAI